MAYQGKLWCCGITSTEKEKINDLIKSTKDYVDGFVWCVDSNSNSDETFNLLDKNKKEGKIVRHFWINAHDWQANEYLHCGIIKDEDWILICDSSEIPTKFFLENLRNNIETWEQLGIGAIYCSGRPYLVKFFSHQYFFLTPHWSYQGIVGKIGTISEDTKHQYIENKRDLDKTKHYCIHNTKYLYCYSRSNQTELTYGKYGQEIVQFHEQKRFEFRNYARKILKLDFTLESLEQYMRMGNFTEEFINYCELEFAMSEFFQIKILGMKFIEEIVPQRYKWSFRNYLNFNDGFINKNYRGTILVYNKNPEYFLK